MGKLITAAITKIRTAVFKRKGETTMYLIAGLGNPTRDYAGTRHNIGYDTITRLCDEYHITLDIKKHKGLCAKA